LASGWPGTTTGPSSPPFRAPSGESSCRPPFCSSGPWHLMQCRSNTACAEVGASAAPAGGAARRRPARRPGGIVPSRSIGSGRVGMSSGPRLCEWESAVAVQLMTAATPLGPTRGTVLYADGKHPRLTARLQGVVWKGKTFHGDGTFTNRWLGGVHAVSAGVCVEPSWLDGRPCLVMQYAPDAPVFGNVRDE